MTDDGQEPGLARHCERKIFSSARETGHVSRAALTPGAVQITPGVSWRTTRSCLRISPYTSEAPSSRGGALKLTCTDLNGQG